jgi:hypothetical protein
MLSRQNLFIEYLTEVLRIIPNISLSDRLHTCLMFSVTIGLGMLLCSGLEYGDNLRSGHLLTVCLWVKSLNVQSPVSSQNFVSL